MAATDANRSALNSLVSAWTRTQEPQPAVEALQAAGVPAGISANALDLLNDPRMHHREAFFGPDDPVAGKRLAMTLPARFSGITDRRTTAAPFHGRDNEYVYRTVLGLTDEEYQSLLASGTIGDPRT